MRVSRLRSVLLLTLASLLSGCASNPAPKTWRPSVSLAQKSTRGGWIRVEPIVSGVPPTDASPVEGELIAIDEHAYHVLTAGGLRSVSRSSTHRITVVAYGTSQGTFAIWAAVGGLSTLSHGAFLVFTAPMWAIAGGIVAVKESSAGLVYDPEHARAFARFPQGLPPGLDPAELGPLAGSSAGGALVPRR
jgi:hypothetical protein